MSAPGPRHPFLDHPLPLAFAHRGGGTAGTENSLAAFADAVRLGYRYLETDVHATRDGVLVAFHDLTLDRVTDRQGAVADLSWHEVSRARIGGTEPVPRLEELLDAFPEARLNIDVKAVAAVVPLVETVRRANAWHRVCVSSFSEQRLARVRALAGPRLATSLGPRGVLALRVRSLTGRVPVDRLLGPVLRRGAVCVQVPERSSGVTVVDRAFLRAAHARGLQVHVWTVNDEPSMRRLLDLGVDGIMTDNVRGLRAVLVERGSWPATGR
ncbi:glycerophosphodiester phosphodiesterase [Wenjunlia vitaminophila]|uniref:Glycerophosphodiester phosphodiesterase n=1 Tax=Wenjunlia vitaminophila TaxID=76728 RepID=A0A0T6LWU1_WENVI|nr:glycerophosphodiester phosphodiesterase [Wenjunlia vitaminophila]KRV50489.1 glycerophosphodiester phosphodiesterase [Wenjunlia vitaminophila]